MSRKDKLVARIIARPPEADFSDVERVLELYGWARDRQSGSHVTFVKAGEFPINVPQKHGMKVKRVYLTMICERLGLD
ncbi:MAG: type II toxin-antitoxin system HicA family toxin [Dehalococcoidia bacterium]